MTDTLERTQDASAEQDPMMMKPAPQKEHAWLKRLVGEWEYVSEPVGDAPSEHPLHHGTEVVRAIGDYWIHGEGTMEDGNSVESMLVTLGFDPQKGRFVGTWAGSMMTYLWVYEGELDESERVLTLSSEGPSFTQVGEMGQYRDVIEIISDDERTLTGNYRTEGGEWLPMMRMRYRRKA